MKNPKEMRWLLKRFRGNFHSIFFIFFHRYFCFCHLFGRIFVMKIMKDDIEIRKLGNETYFSLPPLMKILLD